MKVSIISESQANYLLTEKVIKGDVSGDILNNIGTMEYEQTSKQLSITFRFVSCLIGIRYRLYLYFYFSGFGCENSRFSLTVEHIFLSGGSAMICRSTGKEKTKSVQDSRHSLHG